MLKDNEQLSVMAKGLAHRHRVGMLILLHKTSGLSVGELADVLGISFRSASEHSQQLVIAGLVNKSRTAQEVEHSLTPAGRRAVKFLNDLRTK